MGHIIRVIWNGAFAVAIAVGLAFGATQALSGMPDSARCENQPCNHTASSLILTAMTSVGR